MSDTGLLVFGQNGGPTSRENDYDSRKPRMQTSLVANPPRLFIVDDFPAGTALVSVSGNILREVLATFKFDSPYTPEVFTYFYAKSYGGSITDLHAGHYTGATFILAEAAFTDELTVEVDGVNKEVRIVHLLDDGVLGGGYVSDAPKWLMRIKMYITSNDSHLPSYTGGI